MVHRVDKPRALNPDRDRVQLWLCYLGTAEP